jgi:hypothetical protein
MVDGDPPSSAYEQPSGLEYRDQRAIAGNGSNQNVGSMVPEREFAPKHAQRPNLREDRQPAERPSMFAALAAMPTR